MLLMQRLWGDCGYRFRCGWLQQGRSRNKGQAGPTACGHMAVLSRDVCATADEMERLRVEQRGPTPRGKDWASVQFTRSVMSDSATAWTAARQASLSITNSQSLLKLMSIELVMPSNHLILCRPLLLLPSIFPSIRVFSNESVFLIRWPKYWSFSYSISPSNEYSGLISFTTVIGIINFSAQLC